MNLFTEECILRMRGQATQESDDYGNPIIGPPTDVPAPCWYEPRGSTEDTVAKDQQIYGYWLYLPLWQSLAAVDAVVLEGVAHQVIGEPARTPNGFIVKGFQKVALERVTG